MKNVVKLTGTVMIAGSMILAPLSTTAWAAEAKPAAVVKAPALTPFAGTKLKTFMITKKSYIQVKDIYFQYDNNDKRLFFTLSVHNGDSKPIDFSYYYAEVLATTGGKFSVQAHPSNGKLDYVDPNTTREYTYYASIDPELNYSDLIFRIQKIDFSVPGDYTRSIGQARVTASYKNSVPSTNYYIIRKGNEKLKTHLNKGSKFTLGNESQLQLRYELENVGYLAYAIPNLQFSLKMKNGYIVKLQSDLAENQKIQPGEKEVVTLSGSILSKVDLNGAQLLVSTLSNGEQAMETPLAHYNVVWDAASSFITAPDQKAKLKIASNDIEVSIATIYADKSETQNELTMTIKWENNGDSAVTLPKYRYELMDDRGVRYPVTVAGEEIQLIPGLEKELVGTAIAPPSTNGNFTLLVRYPKEETKPSEYVAAAFKLGSNQTTGPVFSKQYRNEYGVYQIKIARVERLPWGDQDLINAYVEIENQGSESQIIPQITAALKLNGISVNEQNVSLIKLEDRIMIGAKEKTSYIVSTKVPYTYSFNELSLNLTDVVDANTKSTIGLFKVDKVSPAPAISISSQYTIPSLGRRASLEFLNSYVFDGKDNDLIYADFKYTNSENRSKTMPALKAYFKTSEGAYIEAKIPNLKQQLKSNGTSILTATAVVPSTFVSDGNVELIIGEAITDGQYSTPEATPDGFINAISMKLPKNQNVALEEFKDLAIKPYNFTLNSLFTVLLDASNVRLDLKYTLEKSGVFDLLETKRKLYVEIVGNNLTYGKTVEIEPTEGEGFQVGTEQETRVTITGTNIGSLIYTGYDVKIYEEFDGYKRLLASKRYGSFQVGE